jgi:hypothetical protein
MSNSNIYINQIQSQPFNAANLQCLLDAEFQRTPLLLHGLDFKGTHLDATRLDKFPMFSDSKETIPVVVKLGDQKSTLLGKVLSPATPFVKVSIVYFSSNNLEYHFQRGV